MTEQSIIKNRLRSDYYYLNLKGNAKNLVKYCEKCQSYVVLPRKPTNYMSPLKANFPFYKRGIYLLGPFPQVIGQHKFVVVAIDYFIKYVEAES